MIERRALRMANYRRRPFWMGSAVWVTFFFYPLIPGWLIRRAYNELVGQGLTVSFFVFALAMVFAEAAMALSLRAGHRTYMRAFEASESLLRANVLHAQLANGGTEQGRPAPSSGDAVARLRDDPHDMLMLVDNWVDVLGALMYGVVALAILASIDPLAATIAVAPLLLVGFGNNRAGNHIRKLRQRSRRTTSDTTDFLAAAFGASLTVKVSGANKGVLGRIDELNGRRSKAMVSDQTWADALWSVNGTTVDICVGLALIVASRRTLDVGDIALFTAYAVNLIWLPQKVGGLIVGRRRFEVSAERLDSMMPASVGAAPSDALSQHRPLPLLGGPDAPLVKRPQRSRLTQLSLNDISCADRGLLEVSFSANRGTLTVISGPVGTGKTSLLRAILGLLSIDSGEICWNASVVHDPAAFFIPPQCAYVPQIPHLFSETLLDNVLLGSHDDPWDAICLAAFDDDVKSFSQGVHTLIGAGGVRLSGGQAQRAAAARALVQRPELLLLDDLTSALDVETEIVLWDRLAATESTVIAVSNRPIALSRASQVIELR